MDSNGKITGCVPVDAFLTDIRLLLKGHDFASNDGETAKYVATVRIASVALRTVGLHPLYLVRTPFSFAFFASLCVSYDCMLIGHNLSKGIEVYNAGPGFVDSWKKTAETVKNKLTGRNPVEESLKGTITAEIFSRVRSLFPKDGR